MSCFGNSVSGSNERNCDCTQGPFAHTEVSKVAYFGAWVNLIFGLILIWQPVFSITAYGVEMSYAFNEIDQLSWACVTVLVLNLVSIFCLLIPQMKSFEWTYQWHWSAVIAGISIVELALTAYILMKKEKLMEETLIGSMYKFLSIELNLTVAGWALILTFILTLACAVKMLIDARK